MEEREYIIRLFDLYGNLLSDKEKEMFKFYYFEDLSFSEIADNMEFSKSYASKFINNISEKLLDFEDKLKLNNKLSIIKDELNDEVIFDLISKIIKE